jgi:hypothetical protein
MTEKQKLEICDLGFWTGVITLNPPLIIGSLLIHKVIEFSVFLSPK